MKVRALMREKASGPLAIPLCSPSRRWETMLLKRAALQLVERLPAWDDERKRSGGEEREDTQ